ncbi:MAG: hypothetical protein VYD19_03700, partial [Myxococcota bacterium]|nr:hypothetical protein [Myxococcota bacterium]
SVPKALWRRILSELWGSGEHRSRSRIHRALKEKSRLIGLSEGAHQHLIEIAERCIEGPIFEPIERLSTFTEATLKGRELNLPEQLRILLIEDCLQLSPLELFSIFSVVRQREQSGARWLIVLSGEVGDLELMSWGQVARLLRGSLGRALQLERLERPLALSAGRVETLSTLELAYDQLPAPLRPRLTAAKHREERARSDQETRDKRGHIHWAIRPESLEAWQQLLTYARLCNHIALLGEGPAFDLRGEAPTPLIDALAAELEQTPPPPLPWQRPEAVDREYALSLIDLERTPSLFSLSQLGPWGDRLQLDLWRRQLKNSSLGILILVPSRALNHADWLTLRNTLSLSPEPVDFPHWFTADRGEGAALYQRLLQTFKAPQKVEDAGELTQAWRALSLLLNGPLGQRWSQPAAARGRDFAERALGSALQHCNWNAVVQASPLLPHDQVVQRIEERVELAHRAVQQAFEQRRWEEMLNQLKKLETLSLALPLFIQPEGVGLSGEQVASGEIIERLRRTLWQRSLDLLEHPEAPRGLIAETLERLAELRPDAEGLRYLAEGYQGERFELLSLAPAAARFLRWWGRVHQGTQRGGAHRHLFHWAERLELSTGGGENELLPLINGGAVALAFARRLLEAGERLLAAEHFEIATGWPEPLQAPQLRALERTLGERLKGRAAPQERLGDQEAEQLIRATEAFLNAHQAGRPLSLSPLLKSLLRGNLERLISLLDTEQR